ncbi:MAG: hypothetical protein A2X94_14355 [Bdellovibrionales bacterium GWB1_55_8]|nr:MAG: hypothetical protein A2X94_14355 [Bdellovibrionales bacterium GWB1_55_8]
MKHLFTVFALSLLCLVLVRAAQAAPNFPSEVLTFEGLADDFRLPVSMKIRDMRKSFRIREIRPGEIEFLNDANKRVLTIALSRFLSKEATMRIEDTVIRSPDGKLLFKESIQTEGSELRLTAPVRRIFLEGRADYAISALNEVKKVVRISADEKEIFRFVSSRAADGKSTFTDIYIGDAKILAIRDLRNSSDTTRALEYEREAGRCDLTVFGGTLMMEWASVVSLRAVSEEKAGFLLNSHRYDANGAELFGLGPYLAKFNSAVYSPLVVQSAGGILNHIVNKQFPITQSVASIGANSRFLDELVNLRSQVEQAKANPSLLTSISTTLSSFVNSITEGSLVVDDKRPKE